MSLPAALRPTEPPRRYDQAIDLAVGVGGALLCLMWAVLAGEPAAVVAAVLASTMVLRRTSPQLTLVASTVGALLLLAVVPYPHPVLLSVPVIVYTVARWAPHGWARAALVVGIAGAFLGPFRWTLVSDILVTYAGMLMCLAAVFFPYALGRRRGDAARAERALQEQERLSYERRVAEAEQQMRMAEINERQRIARELHDIVAHSLSVIIVQSEGARALTAKRPEAAAETLGTISDIGREALDEMRRIMGVLRGGAEPQTPEFEPASGLADIADLVARTSPRARFTRRGDIPAAATPALGLTAYRVVQEALTNVLKHAGPDARAEVLLDCLHPAQLRVQVVDDGRGAAATTDGLGNGLQGMFERVHALGGTLVAQPRSGAGFLVRAVLPLPPTGSPTPSAVDVPTRIAAAPGDRPAGPAAERGHP